MLFADKLTRRYADASARYEEDPVIALINLFSPLPPPLKLFSFAYSRNQMTFFSFCFWSTDHSFRKIDVRWKSLDIDHMWTDCGKIIFVEAFLRHFSLMFNAFWENFFITRNVFHQRRSQHNISLNANYIIDVDFQKSTWSRPIRHLARQVYPDNPKFLEETLRYHIEASRVFVARAETIHPGWFRTCIFPEDMIHYVYVPCKSFSNGFV